MDCRKMLVLGFVFLSFNFIYAQKNDFGSLNILPYDIKKEILKYILLDSNLKNKSFKELQEVLCNLKLVNNGFKNIIIERNEYTNKILKLIKDKQAQLGFRLINSVRAGNLEKVKESLELGASPNSGYLASINLTALMYASLLGYKEIAKQLIKYGANIDIKNIHGRTALIFAVSWKNLNIVQLLIESGADLNIQDIENKTALDFANKKEIKDILEEAGNNLKKKKNRR